MMAQFTLASRIEPDPDMGPPWLEHDGHGPVSDWTRRPKAPGEIVLSRDGPSYRYYDYAEACRIARADGWGCEGGKRDGETDRAYAARAAREDYARLRGWCEDDWGWIGVVVTASREGIVLGSASLWGIESDAGDDYIDSTVKDLTADAIAEAQQTLARLVGEMA